MSREPGRQLPLMLDEPEPRRWQPPASDEPSTEQLEAEERIAREFWELPMFLRRQAD